MASEPLELRKRAADLIPLLQRQRHEAEDAGSPSPLVLDALKGTGLYRLGSSAAMGGMDLSLGDIWAILETVALGDPAVAWILANTGVAGLIASRLPVHVREQLFATEQPIGNAAVFVGRATRVDDGFMLRGSWPFCTGALLARWFICGGVVYDDETPCTTAAGGLEARTFVVPAEQVLVAQTWLDATAMRATGSHAVSVKEAFVPTEYAPGAFDPLIVDGPLYRLPRFTVFVGSAAAGALACFSTALESVIDANSSKVSSVDAGGHWDRPNVQQAVAQGAAALRSLRTGLYDAADEVWDAALGGNVSPAARATLYSSMYYTLDQATAMVSRLYAVASSAAYATRNPVERALRDAHAFAASLESFRSLQYSAGRVLLGHEPANPMF